MVCVLTVYTERELQESELINGQNTIYAYKMHII